MLGGARLARVVGTNREEESLRWPRCCITIPLPRRPGGSGLIGAKRRVREVCEAINAGTQPLHNVAALQRLEEQFSIQAEGAAAWVDYWGRRRLAGLEPLLARVAGRFSFGDGLGLAGARF